MIAAVRRVAVPDAWVATTKTTSGFSCQATVVTTACSEPVAAYLSIRVPGLERVLLLDLCATHAAMVGAAAKSRIGMAPVSSRSETLHLFPARTYEDGYFPVAFCGRVRPYVNAPPDPMPMGGDPIPVLVAMRRCRSCLLALDTQTRSSRTTGPRLDT